MLFVGLYSIFITTIPNVQLFSATIYDKKDEKVAFNQICHFVIGAGGFGGKQKSELAYPIEKHPNRLPDSILEEKTCPDQVSLQCLRYQQLVLSFHLVDFRILM